MTAFFFCFKDLIKTFIGMFAQKISCFKKATLRGYFLLEGLHIFQKKFRTESPHFQKQSRLMIGIIMPLLTIDILFVG